MWLSHKKLPASLCELLCWWWRDAPASPPLCHALSWLTFLVNTAVSQRPLCKIVFQFCLNFYLVIVWVSISVSLFLAAFFVLVFWSIEDAFYSPFRPQVLASGCLLVQNVLVLPVCSAPVNSGERNSFLEALLLRTQPKSHWRTLGGVGSDWSFWLQGAQIHPSGQELLHKV